jgi:glutaredoxin
MSPADVVTLYGRPGCHLCDEARAGLEEMLLAGLSFELREVDIEGDEELHRRLLELIPAIDVNGTRVSELIFEPDAVIARLDTFPP